ncbi:MAG: ASPIC/UnbV domain-containing protein, partial [Gemmatimonadota bacterium]|nr:ASPIC/UnbV domain-containing protein [Gemmatimonadota bacterium]
RLVAGGTVQVREVGTQSPYLSQNSLIQHFGLGTLTSADTLEIRWPSGLHQIVLRPAANQLLQVSEGAAAQDADAKPR